MTIIKVGEGGQKQVRMFKVNSYSKSFILIAFSSTSEKYNRMLENDLVVSLGKYLFWI